MTSYYQKHYCTIMISVSIFIHTMSGHIHKSTVKSFCIGLLQAWIHGYIFFKFWLETSHMMIHDATLFIKEPPLLRWDYPKICYAKQQVGSLKGVQNRHFYPLLLQHKTAIQGGFNIQFHDNFFSLQKDCRWCSAVNLQWNNNL